MENMLVISAADYRTILLHVEKISNGQRDFIGVLKKELKDLLHVEADELIAEITTEKSNCLDCARMFLSKISFVIVEDDGTRYQLVGNELELMPAEMVNSSTDTSDKKNKLANTAASSKTELINQVQDTTVGEVFQAASIH